MHDPQEAADYMPVQLLFSFLPFVFSLEGGWLLPLSGNTAQSLLSDLNLQILFPGSRAYVGRER
jgi:hypothetical protein